MKYHGINVILNVPLIDIVPWVYLKDHATRYPKGITYSVMGDEIGHMGFINVSDDGVNGEANYGGMFYTNPMQLHSEDAIRLVVEGYLREDKNTGDPEPDPMACTVRIEPLKLFNTKVLVNELEARLGQTYSINHTLAEALRMISRRAGLKTDEIVANPDSTFVGSRLKALLEALEEETT